MQTQIPNVCAAIAKCWVLKKASLSRSFISFIHIALHKLYIFILDAGKGLKLGGAAQASGGGGFLKPSAMSLPSRPLGGGTQGPGLARGSLKASATTDKEDDGFDADDWFKVRERILLFPCFSAELLAQKNRFLNLF